MNRTEKFLERVEVVRADQIDVRRDQFTPDFWFIGRPPKPQTAAIAVCLMGKLAQQFFLVIRNFSIALPEKITSPILAHERKQIGFNFRAEFVQPPVAGRETIFFPGHHFNGPIAGDDHGQRVGLRFVGIKFREQSGVTLQKFSQDGVSALRLRLDVNQQNYRRPVSINASAIFQNLCAQRLEIKFFQCEFRADIFQIVRDEQLPVGQMNVRLDAAKPMFERLEQRTFVFVVIVGVSAEQRRRIGLRAEKENAEK